MRFQMHRTLIEYEINFKHKGQFRVIWVCCSYDSSIGASSTEFLWGSLNDAAPDLVRLHLSS